ncbi:acyl-CoA dehydrogenase family protein [Aliikangiella maris]|uniref:Acyl-CoA dehydrogenase family protein n=2 Tax=Aliikangiella maris TaxID=3162458 RepID=A0ABV3MS40_9GAMM
MNKETEKQQIFRNACRDFLHKEAIPQINDWESNGIIDKSFWLKAGKAKMLGIGVAENFGGQGESDYHYPLIVIEEMLKSGVDVPGFVSHNDVTASYIATLGNDSQKQRWLPALCSGELIAAIAVTEPDGGSDTTNIKTQAVLQGDHYLVNGCKSYITNGINADLVVTAVKTSQQEQGRGISLLVIERGLDGFTRGENYKKLGWPASDNSALYFKDCRVPKENLLGRENLGNAYFMGAMPRERLSIACVAVVFAELIFQQTLNYVKHRQAFGQAIGHFQHNRFLLAQLDTELKIARIYLESSIDKFNKNQLSVVEAAQVKLWTTELQFKVADHCLQLHGASGYLQDSPIGKAWSTSRVQKIYGGTSEILKEIISKSLGL